jgi:hypothetical protein
MSTNCDRCGYRDNEVKSGGAISEKGKRITVKVEDREDLSRDILKVISIVSLLISLWPDIECDYRARQLDCLSLKSISSSLMVRLEAVLLPSKVFWSRCMRSSQRRCS